MDRADVIRLAKEAGIEQVMRLHGGGSVVLPTPILERFAALVRAQVLEEAAQRADEHAGAWKNRPVPLLGYTAVLEDCAAAIRGMKSDSGHSVSSVAEASTAPLAEGDRNQCDGCARGLPVTGGLHRGEGAWDLQGCTADRYASADHSYRQQTDREYRDEIGKSMEATLRAAAERVLGPICDAAPDCPCFNKHGQQLTACFMAKLKEEPPAVPVPGAIPLKEHIRQMEQYPERKAALDRARERIKPTKIVPGSDMHLTVLMAPYSLNFFCAQDRQHLLSWGRDVWSAAQAHIVEAIARQWDGCMTEMVGIGAIDIGATIRQDGVTPWHGSLAPSAPQEPGGEA